MPRQKGEYIFKEVTALEVRIKEKHGKKSGAVMIAAARQNVEYQLGSDGYSQMHYVRLYTEELKKRL